METRIYLLLLMDSDPFRVIRGQKHANVITGVDRAFCRLVYKPHFLSSSR